ncbi:MAG TPA: MATE family efflux transporter [Candidatus Polarisedimenticolaceae bacterium]|nr:MATE family efflux transporter [Candidatus Polarisedimenticolaceae bacterium]
MTSATPTPIAPVAGLRAETGRLLKLAGPVMIAYLGTISMGTVDMKMAGLLGAQALAAAALGHTWSVTAAIFVWGAGRALDPVVAQAQGAGDVRGAGLGLTRGLAMTAVLAIPVAGLYAFAGPVLRALGQPGELVPMARAFCLGLIPGLPAIFAFIVLRNFLQAVGVVRPASYAILIANLANAGLDYVLMFGKLGLPALGVTGCAISTSINEWLMLGLLVFFSRRTLKTYWPGWAGAFDAGPLRRITRLGVTLGAQFALEVWAFHAAGFMMGRLGTTAFAAHAIAINLATISFMVPAGIGAAAATRIGHLVGSGNAWPRSAALGIGLGALVMIVPAALFIFAPRALASFYTGDAAVLAAAAIILPLAGAFQLFDGIQAVAFGVLRGAGDTHLPAAANVIGYWVLGLPAGWILAFTLDRGVGGVWSGLVLGLAVVAAILLARVAFLAKRGARRVVL